MPSMLTDSTVLTWLGTVILAMLGGLLKGIHWLVSQLSLFSNRLNGLSSRLADLEDKSKFEGSHGPEFDKIKANMAQLDKRLALLEKTAVNKAEFSRTIDKVYSKIDEGFGHMNDRLDKIYSLMLNR